jgi:RHS repeat-associated protein
LDRKKRIINSGSGAFKFEGNSLNLVHHGSGFIKNLKSTEYQTGTQNGNMQGSSIVSTQKIGEGKYEAENQISLLPGFEAKPNVKFSAEIKPQNPHYQWQYALSDHLGNLRVLFTDKNNDGLIAQSVNDSLNEVLTVRNYSPFGLELGGSHKNLDYQNGYKFGGKEHSDFTTYTDFGGRWLDMTLSKWTTFDPMGEKFYPSTLNSYAVNSPINFIDTDGKYAVSVHYQLTYDALRSRGYSHKRADLIAHYSSTYADHPKDVVRGIDHFGHNLGARSHLSYRSGINYNYTSGSQDEAFSVWHAMMSNAEADAGMTEEEAMKRGLKFGWDNIFAQKDGDDLGKLGQGIHALQDAIAHKGAKTDDHLGRNLSSVRMLINDMYGSTKEAAKLTKSALVVYDLLQGRQSGLKSGDTLNFSGMSSEQLLKITQLLVNQGFQGTIKTE